VLVRLDAVTVADLRELLADAHRCQVPVAKKRAPKKKT
jgi:hypothetical protein